MAGLCRVRVLLKLKEEPVVIGQELAVLNDAVLFKLGFCVQPGDFRRHFARIPEQTVCCVSESVIDPKRQISSAQLMGMVSSTTAPSSLRMDMRIAPLL